MSKHKIFSEQEASEILQKAVKLQEAGPDKGDGYKPGITYDELKKIAEEAGLDPQYLDQAIEVPTAAEVEKGPFHLSEKIERVIDGELDPNNFDVLLDQLRPTRAGIPVGIQVGRALTATTWTGISQARIEVSSRKGRTRLRVNSNSLMAYFMGLHMPLIIGIVTMAGMAESGRGTLGALLGGGLILAGMGAFKWLANKGHKAARKVADKLQARIEEELAAQEPAPELRENLADQEDETVNA